MRAARSNNQAAKRFRLKLLMAMMLMVCVLTVLGLVMVQRNITASAARDLQRACQAEISAINQMHELRDAALLERCHVLAGKPRIHAALEDNALDLLYPSARDELRDLMTGPEPAAEEAGRSLHARFYRFLDSAGRVLPPDNPADTGILPSPAESKLTLQKLPQQAQLGYIAIADRIDEVVAVPIFSTDTGEVISALVVGFKPFDPAGRGQGRGFQTGLWMDGRLNLPAMSASAQNEIGQRIKDILTGSSKTSAELTVSLEHSPHLLFVKQLNPGSLFPAAYQVFLYSLAGSMARLQRLRWQIGSAGGLLLLGGFLASNFLARRLAVPVQELARDSETNRAQRRQAEAALALTSEKLNRSTRYSADASHQLKSPVTVLRAGLESLLRRNDLRPQVYEELSGLVYQTHRLTGVIDDLLLLSRMDAGHLHIDSQPVNLSLLLDEWLDDLGALTDSPEVAIEKRFSPSIHVAGERRYTSLIIQNLLENARKYNRAGGRIEVTMSGDADHVILTIGNTGPPIAAEAQQHIFERFRRADTSSTVSGHGLGLNLARDLMRLHGGDLRLVKSVNDWTVFEARFRAAQEPVKGNSAVA